MAGISIYAEPVGAIEIRIERDTVWLTQAQLVELFEGDQSAI